jgi:PAS domain S-box-containing protein
MKSRKPLARKPRKKTPARPLPSHRRKTSPSVDLERFFDSALDLLCIGDYDGNFFKLNPAWENTLGFPLSELVGKPYISFIHPEDQPATLESIQKLDRQKDAVTIANRVRCKDGTYRWLEWKAFLRDKFVYAAARDITDRIRTENDLRESQRMLETILDTIPVRVFWKDRHSVFQGCNRPFARDAGFSSPADIIGRDDYHMGWAEQAELYRTDDRTVINTGREKIGYEEPQTRTDGRRIWLRTSKIPLRNFDGGIRGVLGTYEDITTQKLAEKALRESEERYQRISRTITDYIFHVRVENGKAVGTVHGPRCLAVTGYTVEEFDADPELWIRMVEPEDRPRVIQQMQDILSGGDTPGIEYRLTRKDGSRRWVRNTSVLHSDPDGRLLGYDGLIQDITERMEAELLLHAQHGLALALNATTNLEEGLRLCVETAIRVSGVEAGGVYLLDDRTGAMDLVVHQGLSPDFISAIGHLAPDDPQTLLMKSGEPVFTNSQLLQELIGPHPLYGQFRSLLGIPIRHEHRVIGSLNLASTTKPSIPKPIQEALETLVAQINNSIARLRSEGALGESEERYRQLFESVSDAIILVENRSGRILEANSATSILYGYNREELLAMKNIDLSAEPHATRKATQTTPLIPENVVTIPLRLHRRKDGAVFPVEITSRYFSRHGIPVHISAIRDISQRQKTEEALRESRQMLETVLNTIPARVFWKDRDLVYMGCNRAFALDAGFKTPEEIVGIDDFKIGWGDHTEAYRRDDQSVIATGTAKRNYEEPMINQEGRKFWVSTSKIPLRDPEGNIRGVLGTYEDITERKQAEEEIRALNVELEQRVAQRTAQLEAANKELEAFSYSVSHDLRAPLRAIDGFTRVLEEDYGKTFDPEGRRLCAVIRRNTRSMNGLIDDLLALSRLSRTEMDYMPTDMEAMVQSVFQELTPPESRARIDFQTGCLPKVLCDPILLRQVWINLISNAVKFSQNRDWARIRVECRSTPEEDIFSIRDNGAGFDMQYADRVFSIFQRLHNESDFEGTGVGLAIVQRAIHRHAGRVWAEGEVDKGATFFFTLPKMKPENGNSPARQQPPGTNSK